MLKITQEGQGAILLMICLGYSSAYEVADLTNYPEFEDRPSTNFTSYSLSEQECPQTTYNFPADHSSNYLRLQPPVPDLNEFTICGWYTLYDGSYNGLFSYSNNDYTNAFGVVIQRSRMYVYMNDVMSIEYLDILENTDYHICFTTFASSTGHSYLFVDGQLTDVFQANPGVIKGGGIALIGVLQQYPSEGKLSNFMLWNRILTFDEISNMYINPCFCVPDYLLTAETKNIDMFGAVSALATQKCST